VIWNSQRRIWQHSNNNLKWTGWSSQLLRLKSKWSGNCTNEAFLSLRNRPSKISKHKSRPSELWWRVENRQTALNSGFSLSQDKLSSIQWRWTESRRYNFQAEDSSSMCPVRASFIMVFLCMAIPGHPDLYLARLLVICSRRFPELYIQRD
jgi:hypothetical protein